MTTEIYLSSTHFLLHLAYPCLLLFDVIHNRYQIVKICHF